MAPPLTRRAVLAAGGASVVLASCGGGDPPPGGGPEAGSGAGLLNSLVALENASVAAWAAIAAVLDGEARDYARRIRAREQAHAERVGALVRALGASPPEGRSPRDYATGFPRMDGPGEALRFARDLEDRQLRAYLDALASLPRDDQRRTAAEIAAEEAEDLAVVHVLAGDPAAPQAFVTGVS